jgi:GNAT superfamily N-acetyltransferase
MQTSDIIRRSTVADLAAIHTWLAEEERNGVEGNFLCNWEIIERCHQRRRLTAYIDGHSGAPVAFQLGGLICPGVIQVRSDMRGRGIGRKLVDYCVKAASRKHEYCLIIECTPPSSVPFWQKMGFTLFGDRAQRKAYRLLTRKHRLPAGKAVEVSLTFGPEWGSGQTQTSTPPAVVTTDGVVHLGERVLFSAEVNGLKSGVVVEIIAGGRTVYSGKATYSEAKSVGVCRCTNGFYVDAIDPAAV